MTRTHILGLLGGAAVVLLIGLLFTTAQAPAPEGSVSNETDTEVRAQAVAFGQQLKSVSLLAQDATLLFEAHYAPFVAPELLAAWKANPSLALGRQTSSPWPDRLEVVSVERLSDTSYRVEGNVIEVGSADRSLEPAGIYPVTLVFELRNSAWLITSVQRGAYSTPPQRTSVQGIWECLPHRDRTGPQTMECAFGIAKDQSDGHLAVDTRLMSSYPVDFPVGTKVRIEGVLVPREQLSSDVWQKYDIDGIISATSITKL